MTPGKLSASNRPLASNGHDSIMTDGFPEIHSGAEGSLVLSRKLWADGGRGIMDVNEKQK